MLSVSNLSAEAEVLVCSSWRTLACWELRLLQQKLHIDLSIIKGERRLPSPQNNVNTRRGNREEKKERKKIQ